MRNKKNNFEDYFYKASLTILIIFIILFLILSQYLNKNFFLKLSVDKELNQNTISSIKTLQFTLLFLSIFSILLFILIFYLKNKFKSFIKKYKNTIQNLLLLLIIIFILILIGEIVAYIINDKDHLIYSLTKTGIKLNLPERILNNEGVRDRNFIITKPDNTIRIIVLGDSYTYGSGIQNTSDTYPKVLERKLSLSDKSQDYEVLNFGISGVDTERELEILKGRALKYNPDIIIIGYVLNDLQNIDPNIKTYERIRLPIIGFALSRTSYLYNFLELRINQIALRLGKKPYEKSLIEYFNSDINKNEAKKILNEISTIAKENNIKVLLTVFPPFFQMDSYPFADAHRYLEETALENNFYFLDLLETYKNYTKEELEVSSYNSHPNEFGHELAAQAIFQKLKNENLI